MNGGKYWAGLQSVVEVDWSWLLTNGHLTLSGEEFSLKFCVWSICTKANCCSRGKWGGLVLVCVMACSLVECIRVQISTGGSAVSAQRSGLPELLKQLEKQKTDSRGSSLIYITTTHATEWQQSALRWGASFRLLGCFPLVDMFSNSRQKSLC